jgi:hypothetical protein
MSAATCFAFAAWLVVVAFAVTPFSFAEPQRSLPAIYCTYENDPFA